MSCFLIFLMICIYIYISTSTHVCIELVPTSLGSQLVLQCVAVLCFKVQLVPNFSEVRNRAKETRVGRGWCLVFEAVVVLEASALLSSV